MNLLPAIDKPRKGFKFSNPLSGVTYNNNFFLQQCQYDPDPQKNLTSMHKRHSLSNTPATKQQKQGLTNMQLSRNRTKYWTKLSDSKINYSMVHHKNNSMLEQSQHKVNKNGYKFPDIQIKIIDQISSYKDFMEKNLKINLGHYFGMFFKKSLAGGLTVDFVDIVQKYLQVLSSKMNLDVPADTKDYPSQFFNMKSKRAFVQKIQELEAKKSFKPIQQIIKFYCIPTRQFRESCFRDILHMISQSLYEKFNLNKQRDYVLLDQNGRTIQDICSIKFSTTHLLITIKPHHERSFHQYRAIIQSNLQNFKKMSFSDELKKTFRGIIAAGKFQQSKIAEPNPFANQHNRRKVDSRMQKSKSPQKSAQKYNPAKTTNSFLSKSKQKLIRTRKSKSSLASPTSALKLNQSIPTKIRSLSAKKRIQVYRQCFQKLQLSNNVHDITFNHNNTDRLLMKVFKKQLNQFQNKSENQVNKIIKAFKIDPQSYSIGWEQFLKICEVANCKGDNQDIVGFVTRYLPFNQYGEMDKYSLAHMVAFVLDDVNGDEVVLEIIWSWLEKNHLIQNNVLVRNTLQSWYEKNKMAFVIMVSLIFGNNQASWIDMAYEVLI